MMFTSGNFAPRVRTTRSSSAMVALAMATWRGVAPSRAFGVSTSVKLAPKLPKSTRRITATLASMSRPRTCSVMVSPIRSALASAGSRLTATSGGPA